MTICLSNYICRKPAKHPCCFSRSPKTDMMIVYTSIENKMYMNSFRPYIFKSKELLFYLTLWIWSFTKKNLWLVCLFVYGTACARLKVGWKTGEYLITVYRVILLQAQRSLSEVKENTVYEIVDSRYCIWPEGGTGSYNFIPHTILPLYRPYGMIKPHHGNRTQEPLYNVQ